MALTEQLAKEHAAHDPHGLKSGFDNSAKHSHVMEPYVYQEFPKALYKKDQSLTVHSTDALQKALNEGWSETPVASEPAKE